MKKFVTAMLLAISLVSDDFWVIWSILAVICEALTWAEAEAARPRSGKIDLKCILTVFIKGLVNQMKRLNLGGWCLPQRPDTWGFI